MAVKGEVTTDLYRQMMDLQEKLRQSEAERIRLEEMFTVLVKTFREEENMRLKSLENRYHTFLEDCAKRSYRNEKILRSVERVESGASALHAKTERLKLLRNHYEAYLERVIPTWRQPALRYASSAIPSVHEVEWNRHNQLVPEENVELDYVHHLPYGPPIRPGRFSSSNPIIMSECFSNRLSEGEKHIKSFPSERNQNEKNYWNSITSEPEEKGRYVYGYDKGYQGDVGLQRSESRNNILPKASFRNVENQFMDNNDKSEIRGLESALYRKLALDIRPNLTKNLLSQEISYRESFEAVSPKCDDLGKPKRERAGTSPVLKEEQWFSDRRKEPSPHNIGIIDKGYIDDTPRITREPVEIKKPEIIVGKHHPEASFSVQKQFKFQSDSNFEAPPDENVIQENMPKPVNDSPVEESSKKVKPDEVTRSSTEVRQSNPQAKWGLLKHRRTIDKLKETLSFEEAQEPEPVEAKKPNGKLENILGGPTSYECSRKEGDETDTSQSLSGSWRPNGEQVKSPALVVQANTAPEKPTAEKCHGEEISTGGPTYKVDYPQKDAVDANDEIYEDNEETYPESYYEQPQPKSDYSRDIVSNVILEEDESEVNMQGELPEGPVQDQGANNGFEEAEYNVRQGNNGQSDYNSYGGEGATDIKENKEEEYHQNYQPTDPGQMYSNGDMYRTNYSDVQHREDYAYQNQEVNNYNTDGMEYGTTEQYPGNDEGQQYYESEHGNYASEGMSQGENYEHAYNQVENYENNPGMEQYNESDGTYQQEYNQGQDGNYYSQGEYEGYYESQQGQDGEYPGSNEGEQGYTETTAYGNVQGDVNSYAGGRNNLPLRQSNLSHLLESDSESFQMEHGSVAGNEDSDFDFSMSQQQ